MNERLPQEVIEEDHRLEQEAESVSEMLARHRWHWTLDKSNSRRVSLRAYSRGVGRHHSAVTAMVNGYVAYRVDERVDSLGDGIEQAKMGAETIAATEAIAKHVDLAPITVRQGHYPTIRAVRESARERAEQNETSFEVELPTVVEQMVSGDDLKRKRADDRRVESPARSLDADHAIIGATLKVQEFLKHLRGIQWNDEEREVFLYDISRLEEMMSSARAILSGTPDERDWDAELADILKGAPSA